MQNNVNYALVGLFVIVLGSALLGVVFWLTLGGDTRVYDRYRVYFRESVAGLNPQGDHCVIAAFRSGRSSRSGWTRAIRTGSAWCSTLSVVRRFGAIPLLRCQPWSDRGGLGGTGREQWRSGAAGARSPVRIAGDRGGPIAGGAAG